MKKLIYVLSIMFVLVSCTDVESGTEGFYRYYSSGVDTTQVISDGVHWHSPWTEIITMNIRQQAINYDDVKLKDMNQVKMDVDYGIGIRAISGKTPHLYLLHGEEYISGFVDAKVQGAVKDVLGKYTYVQILGSARDKVEDEIETMISTEFKGNYLVLDYVEIKDIQLPTNIQEAITNKEAQEQRNLLAKKKKKEAENLADAQIAKAKGDSTSMIINAAARAEKIKLESATLRANPAYIELIKWQGYANGKGSPFGSNNVFGSGIGILKSVK